MIQRTASDLTEKEWTDYCKIICESLDKCMVENGNYILIMTRQMNDGSMKFNVFTDKSQKMPGYLRILARELVDLADKVEFDDGKGKPTK